MSVKSYLKKSLTIVAMLSIVLASVVTADDKSAEQTIRFAIISDRTGGHVPGVHGQIITEINRLRPEIVVNVGDMIEGYVDDSVRIESEWREYDSIAAGLSMPYYRTPGNHDIWSDYSEMMYHECVGDPYYSFDYRGLHFTILDVGRWEESKEIPEEQIEWLVDDLEKNQSARQTFVFLHKPFWWSSVAEGKPDTLHQLFVKYGVDAVFTGHFHAYFSGEYDGIIYTSLGSSGGGASEDPSGLLYHFAWITVDNEGIHIAPIKMGAVLPWTQVTTDERKIFNPARRYSIGFEHPVMVTPELTVVASKVGVTVDNQYSKYTINDTLRWTIPDGWTIEPLLMPVNLPAAGKSTFYFNISCSGKLYPAPTAAIDINYAENKKVISKSDLRLAREAICVAAKKIKIDGKLKEDCWNAPIADFFSPDGGMATTDPARFYFAYDKKNLYLAAYCEESKMDSLTAHVTEHDGAIYGEDCVGYFIEAEFEGDTIYQIYFNPNGVAFDQKIWKGKDGYADGDRDWNGKYKVKTQKGDDFWSIEAKIPLKMLGITAKPNAGDKMRVNFRRKQRRLGTAGNWQNPIEYYADSYGYLIFK